LQISHHTSSPTRIRGWGRAICASSSWRTRRLTPSLQDFAMESSSSSMIECSSTLRSNAPRHLCASQRIPDPLD
jgi:hypothetical protein